MKRWIHAAVDPYATKTDSKMMAPYKGYRIEKSWEVDQKGKIVKNTILYAVIDDDDDWIGDEYRTLEQAHNYIDELVKD